MLKIIKKDSKNYELIDGKSVLDTDNHSVQLLNNLDEKISSLDY